MTTTFSVTCLSWIALTTLRQILDDLALERAHARLARVVANDAAHRRLGDLHLVGA